VKLEIEEWGRLDFEAAHARQRERVERVRSNPDEGYLCLVEHPPVYTLGRFGSASNLLDPSIPLRKVERGGDVTYHGPGQLVGYAILHLQRQRLTVKGVVAGLERLLSRSAATLGVQALGRDDARGVWVGPRKLASIGLALTRGVTWHGFALNVSTDLSAFARIHPCGIPGVEMTSLSKELGRPVPVSEAVEVLKSHARLAPVR
jgi:lipoyl(octanoyl) transferase